MERIVTQPTDFYRALARGVEHASSVYGGMDYALTFGGNEMPGYHTGPGSHLGYLTGSRHSHLDSAGYSLDQHALRDDHPLDPAAVARELLDEERWRQVLTSLVICLFARNIYTEDIILPALESLGLDWSSAKLNALGKKTLSRKQSFKEQEGFSFPDMRIPKRILNTASPLGMIDEKFMRDALREFSARVHEKD
jgi:aldehyde:ferredoxin oxidoreductase